MSNHLEELVAEWLEYRGYFVRQSVLVGPREKGGHEGELDIVALNLASGHLLHVECSLDALNWENREARFSSKFERGRRFVPNLFDGMRLPDELDQVALLLMAGKNRASLAGARLIRVADLIGEITGYLRSHRPERSAVPSNWPLLRTLQLAAHYSSREECETGLIK